jgi:IPT/TIG domain
MRLPPWINRLAMRIHATSGVRCGRQTRSSPIKPQLESLEDRLAPSASPFAPLNLFAGSYSTSNGNGNQVSGVMTQVPGNLFSMLPNSNNPGTVNLLGMGTTPSGGSEVLLISLNGSTGTWIGESSHGMQAGVAYVNPGMAGAPGFPNLPNVTDLILLGSNGAGGSGLANLFVLPIGKTATTTTNSSHPSNDPSPPPVSNAPTITNVIPDLGIVGAPVLIKGTNFTDATSVKFGGVKAPFVVLRSTLIFALAPPHAAGVVPVSVTTPDGTATDPNGFEYFL